METPEIPQDRQTDELVRLVGLAFITEIIGYVALCVYAMVSQPTQGAWTIVTNGQQGLGNLMLITVGALSSAMIPKK